MAWHSFYVQAGLSFDSHLNETVIDQGTAYRYHAGFQGAVRDPLQHFASLAREPWRENCGGLARKLRRLDALAERALSTDDAASFDAVVFAEDAFADVRRLTEQRLGLPPPRWHALAARLPAERRVNRSEAAFVCGLTPFLCRLYHG